MTKRTKVWPTELQKFSLEYLCENLSCREQAGHVKGFLSFTSRFGRIPPQNGHLSVGSSTRIDAYVDVSADSIRSVPQLLSL
jgi:hypothetical protein